MSGTLVGILGFACIVAIVVTLFKSKTLPSIAFIVFPMILALVLVLGKYYTWEDIASLIKSGFSSTGPTADLSHRHHRPSGRRRRFHLLYRGPGHAAGL